MHLCCCSVAQVCRNLCDPMYCSIPGFLVHYNLPVCSNSCPLSHWCHPNFSSSVIPFLLLPSVFPRTRVFFNESTLHIRWPKYWSFSFSTSPSMNIQCGFPFRVDWFDLPAVQGISRVLSNTTVQKHQFFGTQPSLWSNSLKYMQFLFINYALNKAEKRIITCKWVFE